MSLQARDAYVMVRVVTDHLQQTVTANRRDAYQSQGGWEARHD